MNKPFSQEEIAKIRRMRAQGFTVKQIGKAIGRSHYSIQHKCCNLGIPTPYHQPQGLLSTFGYLGPRDRRLAKNQLRAEIAAAKHEAARDAASLYKNGPLEW